MTQMGANSMGPHSMMSMAPLPPIGPHAIFSPPMSMPMAYPTQRKMPSVVMPYYSRSESRSGGSRSSGLNRSKKRYRRKRRKPKKYDKSVEHNSDNEFSGSGSAEQNFRRTKIKKRRQVLTPVVSYVTKDGYVVYQKKIKKDRAKEWLEMTNKKESKEMFTSAEERQFQKMLKYKKKKRHQ